MRSFLLTVPTIALAASFLGRTNGFVIQPSLSNRDAHTTRSAPLRMTLEPSTLNLVSPLLSIALSPSISPMDPFVEAELFNDAAHIALDLTSLLGPATVAIRAAAVIGRVFAMASDYVPDHAMLPEELVFQVTMLVISLAGLGQSLQPLLMGLNQQLTMRDRKCFASLFRPAGFSWMQYKFLSSAAFEWTEVTPGAIITTDEATIGDGDHNELYWLYNGDAEIQSKGETLQRIAPKSAHLLGDLSVFAKTASSSKHEFPKTTAKAGLNGATLLRINTAELKKLMKNDNRLDNVVRSMLFDGMQARIASLLSK
mmetsp:Transcript_5823/g.9671  ORF Transcript_5823/g.9671 Transcript_5823/m.9671 type:complete len:312 (-) Transcript_5823:352-1287(-)|eukprot:CAMPEP_0119012456 /NCGR_PEP_ID=MMETSP1176-20130426/6737_1 /TAXON_ID=265551 /ORGANISM="Synedropsis recta cf, Strain CCMP1620" /LENGTH=311 /DNA_ID=CAMNT_0006965415 /DNA_START=85 /DNA_END=1020 /DNA_ORIENTATION=+